MGKVRAEGDLIRLQQIADDEPLRQRLAAVHPGDSVTLEVGGFVGRWRRTPMPSSRSTSTYVRLGPICMPNPDAPSTFNW